MEGLKLEDSIMELLEVFCLYYKRIRDHNSGFLYFSFDSQNKVSFETWELGGHYTLLVSIFSSTLSAQAIEFH